MHKDKLQMNLLPLCESTDEQTPREIEYLSGKKGVMVRDSR